ncbi:MAG: Do family serine endopeptidase [Alphaproteobacteria bacterium]
MRFFPKVGKAFRMVNFCLMLLTGLMALGGGMPSQAFSAKSMSQTSPLADVLVPLIPAVVNISTVTHVKKQQQRVFEMPQFPQGTPLDEFFRDFFEQIPGGPLGGGRQRSQKIASLGSGFIIDPQGYVVTNNHVVAEADQITVILNDGTKLKAKLIGRDTRTDLALLKVESSKPLPYVSWGDASKIRVGDDVFAIGNPYGLGGTVTTGIISHIGRDISSKVGTNYIDGYFQTDAAINQGNSGGPLFDREGKVIGVNTAIYSPTGASVGIGFSIPGFIAQPVVEQLKKFGKTKRGWIGIKYQRVDQDIAESLGLAKPVGVLVGGVVPGGPAAEAKIERGDIILKVNGIDVDDAKRFPRLIGSLPVQAVVPVVVWRKDPKSGTYREVTLQMKAREATLEDDAEAGEDKPLGTSGPESTILGLTLKPLSPELKNKLNAQGVWISGVDPDSSAAEKGIQPGDVIIEVDQEEVSTVKDISEKIAKAKREKRTAVLLLLMRERDAFYVSLELPSAKAESEEKSAPKR